VEIILNALDVYENTEDGKPLPVITAIIDGDNSGLKWHSQFGDRVYYPRNINAHELAAWAHALASALDSRIQNTRS